MKKLFSIALVVLMIIAWVPSTVSAVYCGYAWQWCDSDAFGYIGDIEYSPDDLVMEFDASLVQGAEGAHFQLWTACGGHMGIDADEGIAYIGEQNTAPIYWGDRSPYNWHHITYTINNGAASIAIDYQVVAVGTGVKAWGNDALILFASNGILTIDNLYIHTNSGEKILSLDFSDYDESVKHLGEGLGTRVLLRSHKRAPYSKTEYVDDKIVSCGECYSCGELYTSEEPGENVLQIGLSSGVIDKKGQITLDLLVGNNPGFCSAKVCIIYPECFKIADEQNITALYKDNGSGDVLTTYESTGLGSGINFDVTEDPQVENSAYPEFAQILDRKGIDYSEVYGCGVYGYGYRWLGAICMENSDPDNFTGNDALYSFTFNYDASLNKMRFEHFEFFVIVDTDSTYRFDGASFDPVQLEDVQVINGYANICSHRKSVKQNVVETECEKDGYYEIYCPDCDDIIDEGVILAPGHKVESWIIDKEPTPFKNGTEHGECAECHQIIQNILPMTQEDFGLTSDNNGGFITGIPTGILTESFIQHYENMDLTVSVVNREGKVPDFVGTGCVVTCGDMTFTVVVERDLSGDGVIDARDSLLMKRTLTFSLNPTAAQSMAADFDGNGKINAKDNFTLKKILAGID